MPQAEGRFLRVSLAPAKLLMNFRRCLSRGARESSAAPNLSNIIRKLTITHGFVRLIVSRVAFLALETMNFHIPQ